MDFPTWYGIGSYGGLACCLLAAGAIAAYALLRHRGTPRQLARAVLVCLAAGCLIFLPIWWNQNRLDLYGPALGSGEVLLWLLWCAVAGWLVPLSTLVSYAVLAAPQPLAPAPAPTRGASSGILLAALDAPGRMRQPLGSGTAWGRLVPLEGDFAGKPVQLTRQLTMMGRELDNDVVVDDERTSRHHAELHWDHGHVHIVDRRSMNGTLVNRQPVRGLLPLKTGDVIELGAQRYQLEILSAGAPATRLSASAPADTETAKLPGAGSDSAAASLYTLALVGLDGPASGLRWELRDALTTIGRDPEHTVCLPHESVSRLHAQIVRQRTGFFVSDLHSRNGTLVNGQTLAEPRVLHSGDVLRIGEVELRCEAVLSSSHPEAEVHSLLSHDDSIAHGRAPGSHDQPTISLTPRDAAPADAL